MTHDLSSELKNRALAVGFCSVGIAPAAPLALAERAIRERLDSGLLRDYGFSRKSPESFTRPDLLLPGAKSIVVVALPYDASDEAEEDGGPRGRIARFARGRDYHVLIEERLREVGNWLCGRVQGARYRICVDTGPIIDRAAALLAGVGSYGKNACIITPEAGSWVVLGELITNVDLQPDQPAPLTECGDCSICVESCPTGAIAAPFVIDQTKCISHLTQMKGFIPREMRAIIGDRIYGCDVCQEVCPKAGHGSWVMGHGGKIGRDTIGRDTIGRDLQSRPQENSGDLQSKIQNPKSKILDSRPELIPLLNLGADDFERLVQPTAMGWIGRAKFRRNVAVALGNIGDPVAIPELVNALGDHEPVVRAHAAWALGGIGTTEARAALGQAFVRETDELVVHEIQAALTDEF